MDLKTFLENPNAEPKKMTLYRQINVCRWEAVKKELEANSKKESAVAYENEDGWKHLMVRINDRFYCEIFHNEQMIDQYVYPF